MSVITIPQFNRYVRSVAEPEKEKSSRGILRVRRQAMREGLRLARGSDVFLGLDISKTSWHVTARSGGETLLSASFPPKKEALNGLLSRFRGCRVHSAYETGPFGYGLHDWLRSRQVDSMVVSAAHVPGEIGNRVKTDRRDGLKLARTLEAGLLRPIFVPGQVGVRSVNL